jgi:predicted DNA-binding antitoxin AbrB/MazE fold protein
MAQILEAVFDGAVLRPDTPLELEQGARVRITIEAVTPPVAEEESQARSFLRTARSLQLEGPPDWSANLDEYLYSTPNK